MIELPMKYGPHTAYFYHLSCQICKIEAATTYLRGVKGVHLLRLALVLCYDILVFFGRKLSFIGPKQDFFLK